jgi:DNA replication protein DnaC
MIGARMMGPKAIDAKAISDSERSQGIKAAAAVCPLCEGTGWKTVTTTGSANDRRVTRCDCQLRARAQTLLASARIPKRYELCELGNFEFDGNYRALSPARMAACRFVEEYPIDKTGLMLIGTIGVGKTHLAVGMIKELILGKGIACLFYDYRELLKEIQNSYNHSVKTTELDVLRPIFQTEVLVLDELGATRPTDWVSDTVSLILNTRYNDKLTTIITTNFLDGQSAEADARQGIKRVNREDTLGDRIGDRMRSRLLEMCVIVNMQGQDYRERVKRASFR